MEAEPARGATPGYDMRERTTSVPSFDVHQPFYFVSNPPPPRPHSTVLVALYEVLCEVGKVTVVYSHKGGIDSFLCH